MLDQARLVHLKRKLGNHELLSATLLLFHDCPCPHRDPAATGVVALGDALATVDDAAGGKIRAQDELPQVRDLALRVVDEVGDGVGHLTEVVRRDVGRHAHRNTGRPVDEEVGKLGRQDGRLLQAIVKVRGESNRVLLDVIQQLHGNRSEPGLGVPVGRGAVAVHRTEIPLPVDQRITEGKHLNHPYHGVVHRRVAVGVVLPQHVADHRGRFLVGTPGNEPQLVHRVENPTVDRFQSVTNVG